MVRTSLKTALCLLLLVCIAVSSIAQRPRHNRRPAARPAAPARTNTLVNDSTELAAANAWADQQMRHMTLNQKVGQLLFVRVPVSMNKKQQKAFDKNFTDFEVGGICFFKGTATHQLELTKKYQKMSRIPLMVTIDGEWGLGMRLTDCYSFPRQMLMGALTPSNDSLITQFGNEVGRQCRMMGIHVNFAPVCDINCNPRNPVIGCRSFGENRNRVARKAVMYARALQRQGIMAVAKHFPGHGDTDADSHVDLPVISHTKAFIDTVDLYPFRQLVKSGVRGMMVGHLQVNAYDNRPNMPSSLSERIIIPLLRGEMHFDGLIFTDGIDMKAVSKRYKDGESAIRAIRAGNDVILLPIDVEKTVNALIQEAKKDPVFAKMIDDRCHRILREKYRCKLHEMNLEKLTVPTKKDYQRCSEITYRIATKAITLVHNEDFALPLRRSQKVVNIAIGNKDTAITNVDSALTAKIKAAGTVVISLFGNVGSANNYGVSSDMIRMVNTIAAMDSVVSILVIYGSPYILESFPQPLPTNGRTTVNAMNAVNNAIGAYHKSPSAIVLAYQNMSDVARAVPPALYGEKQFEGRLPVSAGNYKEGTGLKAIPRPKDTRYEALVKANLNVACFKKIDSIALNGIKQHAYPGCQILVAKDGKIVYNQCYGRQTYDASSPAIDTNTVFDLASLTKVSATNLAIMKLVDNGKISLDDHLSRYLPYLKHTNKSRITILQTLSHYARLKAYDAYWKKSLEGNTIYRGTNPPSGYIAIGKDVYIDASYRDLVLKQIAESSLQKKAGYVYSDLGFILLGDIVQQVSGQSLDIFMQQHFYGPLKMKSTTFQPLQHGIDIRRIAPTENDNTYRNQQLQGYVHDPNAAAMGGVSGHAGLFSTGNDLFRLYQMMLNQGTFEGKQYISAKTFNTFNSRHFTKEGNRRALGFDKPFIKGRSTHISPLASQKSFGHTGFTGTMVWVDPQYNLVYIFLSNRVYPDATTNKLASLNIRTDIMDLIYKSMNVTK